MIEIEFSDDWRRAHPGASIGLLEISGVAPIDDTDLLSAEKRLLEKSIRAAYHGKSRQDVLSHPVLAAYEKYYRKFEKTYHVQMQLESIAFKEKPFPTVTPLVDINFLAELQTLVLTAGHDVAKLQGPLTIDISRADDRITQMNGTLRPMRVGDMIMKDASGVSCSIIYGQDNRSPIRKETTHVLYVAYAPPQVSSESVAEQLTRIQDLLGSLSSGHRIERMEVRTAES